MVIDKNIELELQNIAKDMNLDLKKLVENNLKKIIKKYRKKQAHKIADEIIERVEEMKDLKKRGVKLNNAWDLLEKCQN